MTGEDWPTFRNDIQPQSAQLSNPRILTVLRLLDPEDEDSRIFRNVENYLVQWFSTWAQEITPSF